MRIYGKTTLDQWREALLAGKAVAAPDHALKVYVAEHKAFDDEARTIRFRITTGTEDRQKDVVNPSGWQLDSFKKNPVVLLAHQYGSWGLLGGQGVGLPIAKAIEIKADDKGLVSTAQFATKEQYPFADTVYQLLKGGFLNAVSVGFRPLKHAVNETRGGIDFLEQELLEYSVVPIPANAEALTEAAAKGIDVAPVQEYLEALLDHIQPDLGLWVPKAQVETVLRHLPASIVRDLTDTPQAKADSKCPDGTEGCEGDHPKGECPKKPKAAEPPLLIIDLSALDVVDVAKPYPNEHACRLADPSKFSEIRSGSREHNGKTYRVLYGKPKGGGGWEQQAFRYPKGSWSAEEARSHCGSHNGSFEAASGKDMMDDVVRLIESGQSDAALSILRDAQPEFVQHVEDRATRLVIEMAEDWYLEMADEAPPAPPVPTYDEAQIDRLLSDRVARREAALQRAAADLVTATINKLRGRAD